MIELEPTHGWDNALADPASTPVMGLPGFIWMPWYVECAFCGAPCTWIDIDFEVRLHPGRCSEAMWDERAWTETFASMRAQGIWPGRPHE